MPLCCDMCRVTVMPYMSSEVCKNHEACILIIFAEYMYLHSTYIMLMYFVIIDYNGGGETLPV
jgi:hypothetical protein